MTDTTIGINGMAHVILTVSRFAAARAFYGRLLPALGMTPVCDTDKLFYCVGARTAIGIQIVAPNHAELSCLQLAHAYDVATNWVSRRHPALLNQQ